MNWLSLLQVIVNYAWLFSTLILMWLIWRSSEKRLQHVRMMEVTLIEVAKTDAESARQAVETTRTLAAIIQNEQAKSEKSK